MLKGVEAATARVVFDALRAFGGYSFAKSHAAAFAVLVYQSAWLKRYHPQAFYVGLLNHQPMGFWSPATIVNDARRHQIIVLPVDVNRSMGRCTVEGQAIRMGFNYVKGFGQAAIERVMTARASGNFPSLYEFCVRTQLPQRLVEHLILAGGMDQWGKKRRNLVWELGTLDYRPDTLDLVYAEDELRFPEVSRQAALGLEYEMLGVSLREHPMQLYRAQLLKQHILGTRDLVHGEDGQQVRVAGLLIVHQAPPTAKGHHFLTLEDEDGFINVIMRPHLYQQYRRVLREVPLLVVEGELQRRHRVIHVLATKVTRIDGVLHP
jgi:error-prone DNA polymerase